jgi:hypothetical protein
MSQNIRHQLPSDWVPHPGQIETLTTPLQKPENLQDYFCIELVITV